jgi:hemolysin activation/secretion protein
VWGPYPFHEAAFIGGWNTVRGFPEQRFAGDASLYGNLELRVSVRHFFVVVPGELGLFALGDAGRVFVRGEQSERWHSAIGGGLSLAFLSPTNTVSLAAADGGEGLRMYARAGFAF